MNILVGISLKLLSIPLCMLSMDNRRKIISYLIQKTSRCNVSDKDSLKYLLELDRHIYRLTGEASIRYGEGIHTKHRHIKYHDFFINHVEPGKHVLDIGCGNGFLDYDVVNNQKNVKILGIDLNKKNIDFAKKNFKRPNLTFKVGDALENLPKDKFDIVILSNVLEHIKDRIEFLESVHEKFSPSIYLIRVPLFERDWRVPLMKELGIDHRLDSTHYVEYTIEGFFDELRKAGLKTEEFEIRWGEIWAVATPVGGCDSSVT